MDKLLHTLLEAIVTLIAGITPAALGAAVSLFYERGLTWGDRFARLAVGIIVSWFASRLVAVLCGWWWKVDPDPFFLQGVGFVFGMIAFKATPAFISGATTALGKLPDAILSWVPRRHHDGDAQ